MEVKRGPVGGRRLHDEKRWRALAEEGPAHAVGRPFSPFLSFSSSFYFFFLLPADSQPNKTRDAPGPGPAAADQEKGGLKGLGTGCWSRAPAVRREAPTKPAVRCACSGGALRTRAAGRRRRRAVTVSTRCTSAGPGGLWGTVCATCTRGGTGRRLKAFRAALAHPPASCARWADAVQGRWESALGEEGPPRDDKEVKAARTKRSGREATSSACGL